VTAPVLSSITLSNPTQGNWDQYIHDNAVTSGAKAFMEHVVREHKRGRQLQQILRTAPPSPRMATYNGCTGRNLVLCGAGPSLRDHWEQYIGPDGIARTPKTDVWACNSALTWLLDQGATVTHGFGIDQTEGLRDEWRTAPKVTYIIASSVNPVTVAHLMAHGRTIVFFHNFVGSPGEIGMYRTIWPTSVMVGDGLNSVNRAMCLAQFLNYKKVTILGADGALGIGDEMHANGDEATAHGATAVIMANPEPIDGRMWRTKPDMVFSSAQIARMVCSAPNRYQIVGNTLPAALVNEIKRRGLAGEKMKAWLRDVADLADMKGGHVRGGERAKGKNMVSRLFTVVAKPNNEREMPPAVAAQ
jgi:hypothetical protein